MSIKLLVSSLTLTIMNSIAFASSVTCPIFLVEATAQDLEQVGQNVQHQDLTTSLDKDGNSSRDGKVVLTSTAGEKIEVYSTVNSSSKINGVKQLELAVFVNGQRDSIHSVLLHEDGISTGTGWHLGPKGATQLAMMAVNSLSDKSLDLRLIGKAFGVLKSKYNVNQSQIDSEAYSISQIAQSAVKAGDLQEGSALGTAIFLGCWLQN